jgi:hypothetical protein
MDPNLLVNNNNVLVDGVDHGSCKFHGTNGLNNGGLDSNEQDDDYDSVASLCTTTELEDPGDSGLMSVSIQQSFARRCGDASEMSKKNLDVYFPQFQLHGWSVVPSMSSGLDARQAQDSKWNEEAIFAQS